MPNWTASMQQTFEFYTVDPGTWKNVQRLNNIKSCSIERDLSAETLGSASFDIEEEIPECYVRVYLVTNQNGITEKHPLGTFMVQTPSVSFDGKSQTVSLDAYTPLLELKESMPPIGYSILKGENVMKWACDLTRENLRAPVVDTTCEDDLLYDFVADPSDTWLTFLTDFIANVKYTFALDELGRILFAPKQDTASLQAIWTYDDGNSSILYPEVSLDRDLYGIPNVVEVVCSNGAGYFYSRVVNDDENSPISTVNRGREIVHRETDPELTGTPTQQLIDDYARSVLRSMSALEYTITYSHGYCPVRIGDCVRLEYPRAGITDVKAKVISQSISCTPGCQVSETAVFTKRLWG